jgi:hypothetical protein
MSARFLGNTGLFVLITNYGPPSLCLVSIDYCVRNVFNCIGYTRAFKTADILSNLKSDLKLVNRS